MAVLKSFELNGNKQSFANWISNLSPWDTPFTSMISKEGINQAQYSWQTDSLAPPMNTGFDEGSDFTFQKPASTLELVNYTSTLRKVVQVSDTTTEIALHGRGSETAYQMMKAGKELTRDLEMMNLHNVNGNPGLPDLASKFFGFEGLCAPLNYPDPDTGAVTHKSVEVLNDKGPWFTELDIFEITYNLYLSGSKADKIMFHPKHTASFAAMINNNPRTPEVYRMFDDMDSTFNSQVKRIKDPLGRFYTLIPNRFMPEDKIYFFTESDWTQTILRSPSTKKLGKIGSATRYLMEMEVGLRHRHHFASGVLTLLPTDVVVEFSNIQPNLTLGVGDEPEIEILAKEKGVPMDGADVQWVSKNTSVFTVKDPSAITGSSGRASAKLSPVGVGSAKLVVTVDGKPLEAIITVGHPSLLVNLIPAEITVGSSTEARALVQKADGTPVGAGVTVNWAATPSTDAELTGVSSVTDASGMAKMNIKGLKVSAVEVTAKCGGGVSNKAALSIKSFGGSVTLTANPNPYTVGDTVNLVVTVTDKGAPVPGKRITWEMTPTLATPLPIGNTDASGKYALSFEPEGNSQYSITAVCEDVKSAELELSAKP